jgi:molybdopterin-guanine dinucleotide biosynthesis protein A
MPSAPLYGLVLVGGRSDASILPGAADGPGATGGAGKAGLLYHGRPQAQHVADLLRVHCESVFVSCRTDQADAPAFAGLPQIHDRYADLGPLAGILSALDTHPEAAWLVAACDLPYLDAAAVHALVSGRDPEAYATAFEGPIAAKSGHTHRDSASSRASGPERAPASPPPEESLGPNGRLPEPLFTIFEPRMGPRIHALMAQGLDCPRKAILRSRCRILAAPDPRFLQNVNDPEEYRRALGDLGNPLR